MARKLVIVVVVSLLATFAERQGLCQNAQRIAEAKRMLRQARDKRAVEAWQRQAQQQQMWLLAQQQQAANMPPYTPPQELSRPIGQVVQPPTRLEGWGDNFGRGWRRTIVTGQEKWEGTGANFGRGWARGQHGEWKGTGDNFGKSWLER